MTIIKEDLEEDLEEEPMFYLKPDIFAGFVKDKKKFEFRVYLINPADEHYTRIIKLTAGIYSDEEGVLETSKGFKEMGELRPYSSLLIDRSDMRELDFLIWYKLDLYTKDSGDKPERLIEFELPKYNYEEIDLPIINQKGMKIKIKTRWGRSIMEQIKGMDMGSRYIKSRE
jgi:hypothetical protein